MCEGVHWGEGFEPYCKIRDPHFLIEKLCCLFCDSVASTLIERHCRCIEAYVHASPEGIYVQDLKYVMYTLEYLSERLDAVPQYKLPFGTLLKLCCLPPLQTKSSEQLLYAEDLENYLTLLGYLIACVHDSQLQKIVTHTLCCLLTRHSEKPGMSSLRGRIIHSAVEKSRLPETVAELLAVVGVELYPLLLQVALLITCISTKCCQQMVVAGAVESIFMRLDPRFMSRDTRIPIPDPPDLDEPLLIRDEVAVVQMSTTVLWCLLRSLVPPAIVSPEFTPKAPSQLSLWCLQHIFRWEVRCHNVTVRNDLMGLILQSIVAFPHIPIVASGLAKDIALLSVAMEIGVQNTWAQDVKFTSCKEDLELKLMLLLADCQLVNFSSAIEILKSQHVMTGVLQIIDPGLNTSTVGWSLLQQWELQYSALRSLGVLIPALHQEFIENKGFSRLLLFIEWYMQEPYDAEVLYTCIQTVTSIVNSGKEELLCDICDQEGITVLINLCLFLLKQPALTQSDQHIMTHIFFILEVMSRNKPDIQEKYGDSAISLINDCLERMVTNTTNDTLSDERLLICLTDFLWECIVWCPSNLANFVQRGGVYKVMDLLQSSRFPVKLVTLGALTDMCVDGSCVPHLVTWRGGSTREQGYKSLFCEIWREEECRINAKRSRSGCFSDIECPLMGQLQWAYSYFEKYRPGSSPAIADLVGSVRPKIYAILDMLNRRHKNLTDMLKEHYHMNYAQLCALDQVTLPLMENYLALKVGEMWSEVARNLNKLGINPTGVDGDVLLMLCQRALKWALDTEKMQTATLRAQYENDTAEEQQLYAKLRECRLAPALEALHVLEEIACTTDRRFLLQYKQRQQDEVEKSLQFPCAQDDYTNWHQHRTYIQSLIPTVMSNQLLSVPSTTERVKYKPLRPVSLESNLSID